MHSLPSSADFSAGSLSRNATAHLSTTGFNGESGRDVRASYSSMHRDLHANSKNLDIAGRSKQLRKELANHKASHFEFNPPLHRKSERSAHPLTAKAVGDSDDHLLTHSHRRDRNPIRNSSKRGEQVNPTDSAVTDHLTGLSQRQALVLGDTDRSEPLTATTRALKAVGLPYPGRVLKYNPSKPLKYDAAAKQWQQRMQERGWSIRVDGFYGQQSAKICRQFQQEKGLSVDGMVGPRTWTAAFRADNLTGSQPIGAPLGSINSRGLNLVKQFEGLVLKAYRDPVGIWTIGYGHTGPEVGPGDVITKAQAEALLKKDLIRFEQAVRSLVKVPLNSNQFSALVSFTFNVGSGALAQSTLLSLLNQRDYQGAGDQFSRWVYGDGRVLPGLVTRRNAERDLFLTPA